MAIAPIEGLTTYSPVANVQPLNYAVKNSSEVSDVFATETTKNSSAVNGTSPVQYPNATARNFPVSEASLVDSVELQRKKQAVDSRYNEIAMKFMEDNPSYTASAHGQIYQMIGSKFDAFA